MRGVQMATATMVARVLYSAHAEIGESRIGAWISGAGNKKIRQGKKLSGLLPKDAEIRYGRDGTLLIAMDVPRGKRGKDAMHKFAKEIQSAIQKDLGVLPGLCPVTSSAEILKLMRGG